MEGQLVAESPETPVDPASGGLGHRAARGFASTLVSSLLVKGILFAGQMMFGWYLTQGQMGLAATAIAASIFPSVIKEFGIQPFLQRHPRRYRAWSADAAWLAFSLSAAAGVVTLIVAPMVGYFTDPAVTGVIAVLALSTLLSGASVVPMAKLSIDLRFVLVARLNTAITVFMTLGGVVLAILGFGPYAVVAPVLVSAVARLLVGLWLVPVKWELWPTWSRCRVILADGWKMAISLLFFQIIWQCDYLILGAIHSQEQVGIYFLAFQLSTQTLTLLSHNLAGVLLPVLGHMSGEWTRQSEGFLRAVRYLCTLGIPLCFAQAAVADPLLRLIWHDKWVDAIPSLQALSIGSAFRLLGLPAASLLLAQGRMTAYLASAVCSSLAFLLIVTSAAHIGGATSVAIAVAIFYGMAEVCIAAVALGGVGAERNFLRGLRSVLHVIAAPLLAGTIGAGLGYVAAEWALSHLGALAATVIGAGVTVAASGGILWLVAPDIIHGLMALLRSIIVRQPQGAAK